MEKREKAEANKYRKKKDKSIKKLARQQKRLNLILNSETPKEDVFQVNTAFNIIVRSSQ